MSTLPPTTNRSPVGQRVYCFVCEREATILRVDCLGLEYAPVMLCDDGVIRMYCGSTLKDYCQHIGLFLTTMEDLSYTTPDIELFRTLWHENSDRETQRQSLYDGLVNAKATMDDNIVRTYINDTRAVLEN